MFMLVEGSPQYIAPLMLRNLTISLVALLVAFGPALHELQKLPGILSHYRHHVEVHGESDLSALEFLLTHFGERSHDDDDHASLPFHGDSICHGHSMMAPHTPEPLTTPVQMVRTFTVEPSHQIPSTPTDGIFQPPRVS